MKKHRFTHEDLYVGAELICLDAGHSDEMFTTGKVYKITECGVTDDFWPYKITTNDGHSDLPINLFELNESASLEPPFMPVSLLTDEQLFLFRVSGKLPERLL